MVIPDDHTLVPVPGKPGYYEISAGYLKEIYDNQRKLEADLESCQAGRK